MYLPEVKRLFRGEMYAMSSGVQGPKHIAAGKLGNPGNSGAGAILLASYYGAERVILLGYDCHKRGGAHHHGDHPKGMGNAGSIAKWPRQFTDVAKQLKAEVINCSPGTELNVFPRGELREVLDS